MKHQVRVHLSEGQTSRQKPVYGFNGFLQSNHVAGVLFEDPYEFLVEFRIVKRNGVERTIGRKAFAPCPMKNTALNPVFGIKTSFRFSRRAMIAPNECPMI